jgi:predicted Rossmann fold nucleotide-binding protein DprA/Smf involved in DNA uptake
VELDVSLSWLALSLTPGLGSRLSARVLREFGTPEGVFAASRTSLEACNLTGPTVQAIVSCGAFSKAEKELGQLRELGVQLLHWAKANTPRACWRFTIRLPCST